MKDRNGFIETEILVIGGGLAGLWASIRAKDFAEKVTLVDKAKVGRSGASVFCHSTIGPAPEDKFAEWKKEFVERGKYLIDQQWIDILLQENSERLRDMERWGVAFEKDEKGELKTEAVRGQKITRTVLYEGRQMLGKVREEASRRGVEIVDRVMITDLLTSDGNYPTGGHIVGAVGLQTRTGEFLVFRCKAAVVSAGGISHKLHQSYVDNVTGDGQAMAFRAGAEMGNMELSATSRFGNWDRRFAAGGQQQFLMYGAKIVNRLGERFMEKYKSSAAVEDPEFEGHTDFAVLCKAMAIEILEGRGPVYFDLRDWPQENIDKMRKILPETMAAFDDAGIDLRKQLVEAPP